jgi:hypothetical protein
MSNGRIIRPGQLPPGIAKTARFAQAIKDFQAQYQTLYNTMEMIRRPVVQFLLDAGVVQRDTKLPLGDNLLAMLKKASLDGKNDAD